jgi:hypothetical protein
LRKTCVVAVACLSLAACGTGGFNSTAALESQPLRLDNEQVVLDQGQLDCGAREDLWNVAQLGEGRAVARLTQKGRDLQFSDDVQIGDANIGVPYAQIHGSFGVRVLQMVSARDDDPATKTIEAKVGIKFDHKCFQDPWPVLMGVRHGQFTPSANPMFRFTLDGEQWPFDKVIH